MMEISEKFIAAAIAEAKLCKGADLGELCDEMYESFAVSGNRIDYEAINFNRRIILNRLALGEICRGEGGFTDEIERVISAVLDEKTWVLPAHSGGVLPDGSEKTIDLFSAQTAAELSIIAENIRLSKNIYAGILNAVSARIFEPFLRYDHWWLNIGSNRRSNPSNWTPWCIHSVMECARVFETDKSAKILELCRAGLENYFNDYPQDGGCDEGAQYWEHSVGHFFECDICDWDKEKLNNMYSFIMRANLTNGWYMNFADCASRISPDPSMIFLMGKQVQNDRLMAFAKSVAGDDITMRDNMDLRAKLNAAKVSTEFESYTSSYVASGRDIIPSLGIGIFRSKFFSVAVKGGNNAENHNHNDCGNFIIMLNNSPVVIDAGVGDYTKDTFSRNRYKIWTMQSSYHNLPDINGCAQSDGNEFCAKDVRFYDNGMVCDIAGAYPKSSGIKSFIRRTELFGDEVRISDSFEFLEDKNILKVNLMLPCVSVCDGKELWVNGCKIDVAGANWKVEEIEVSGDIKLSSVWGDRLYRTYSEFDCGKIFKMQMRIINTV